MWKAKKCPFCNRKQGHKYLGKHFSASIAKWMEDDLWHVYCDCGASGPGAKTENGAIRVWNQRNLIGAGLASKVDLSDVGGACLPALS